MTNTSNLLPMSPAFQALWDTPASNRGTLLLGRGTYEPVKLAGTDTGTLTIVAARRTQGLGLVLTIHEKGSSYWAARGTQRYSGAQIRTFLAERRDATSFRLIELSSVELASNEAGRTEVSAEIVGRLLDEAIVGPA